jgi:uncharacterized protein YukE
MSDWEQQVTNLQKTLDEIKVEVKENRQEVIKLKEEMATGKSAIKTTLFIGSVLSGIWIFIKLIGSN